MNKTTFYDFLNESLNDKEHLRKAIGNIKKMLEAGVLFYRGSDSFNGNVGSTVSRERLGSLTGSNLPLNFTNLFLQDIPSRKRSFFMTNDLGQAGDFGEPFIVFPADSVSVIAAIEEDFNFAKPEALKDFPVLGDDLNTFFYAFKVVVLEMIDFLNDGSILEFFNIAQERQDFAELYYRIIRNNTQDLSETDFEKFDKLFTQLGSIILKLNDDIDNLPSKLPRRHVADRLESNSTTQAVVKFCEILKNKLNFSVLKLLKETFNKEALGITAGSLDEIIRFCESHREKVFELWFTGELVYVSVSFIKEKLFASDEDLRKFMEATIQEQDRFIADKFAEIFDI